MIKAKGSFKNILQEGDFKYFSSLYDRDDFNADVKTVKNALEVLDIIKDKIDWNIALNYFINIGYINLDQYELMCEVLK